MTAGSAGRGVLLRHASDVVLQAAAVAVNSGRAVWRYDPDRPEVVGLVTTDDLGRALIVVYVGADDFELDADFEASLTP